MHRICVNLTLSLFALTRRSGCDPVGRGSRRGGSHSGSCSGRYPCDRCYARTQQAINGVDDSPQNWSSGNDGSSFEGKPIKVRVGATGRKGRFEFLYGGAGKPDGTGHGHVVCNDGETINYWKKPASEGGRVVIDDRWSTEQLARHMW